MSTEITFNKKARDIRIDEQITQCIDTITVSFEKGISVVDLVADTDVYVDVRSGLLKEVDNIGLDKVNAKAYSVRRNKNKTQFRIKLKS